MLLELDLRIQRLRDQIAAGRATLEAERQLAVMIEERVKMIDLISKQKDQASGFARARPTP